MTERDTDKTGGPAEELSYEEARDQLVEVGRTLEQGGSTLAESLALWERGEELARICQKMRQRIPLRNNRDRTDKSYERERHQCNLPVDPARPGEAIGNACAQRDGQQRE